MTWFALAYVEFISLHPQLMDFALSYVFEEQLEQ